MARLFDESFERTLTGFTVVGAPTLDAAIHGNALKFAFGAINCIERDLSYPYFNFYQGMYLFYGTTAAANGIVEWRDSVGNVGDLRFNATGNLELRLNGTLVETGTRVFLPSTLYNLQFWLVYDTTVGRVEVRINNSPVPEIDFFGATRVGAGSLITKFRYGSIAATGSGFGWIDDLVLNDATSIERQDTADVGWPGTVAWFAVAPDSVIGGLDDWTGTGGNKFDNVAANDGDTTNITAALNGKRQAFGFPAIVPPTGAALKAVKYEVIVRGTISGQPGIVRLGFEGGTPANEVQVVTLTGVTAPWQLSLEGVATAYIPPAAAAAAVQIALRALSPIHEDGVTVTGSAGGPYTVTFGSHLTQTTMSLLGSGTTTGSIAVVRSVAGVGVKYGGVPFGPSPLDLTDTYSETLVGTSYTKRIARRRTAPNGQAWTLATANASRVALRAQGLATP